MKVLLLGANGRNGRLVMNQAIAMGHDVSVLVRHVGLSFLIVRGSGLDWIISRPPVLTDGKVTGKVRVLIKGEVGHTITRADLAMWLIEQLESRVYVGQAVVVVNH